MFSISIWHILFFPFVLYCFDFWIFFLDLLVNCFFQFSLQFQFFYITFLNSIILLLILIFFVFPLSTSWWFLVLSFNPSLFGCFLIWPSYFYFVFYIANNFYFQFNPPIKELFLSSIFFSTLNLLIAIFYFKSFYVIGFFPDFIIQHLICWGDSTSWFSHGWCFRCYDRCHEFLKLFIA